MFLIMKSAANAIAEVCEIIDGGDSDKISIYLAIDPVGRKFLSEPSGMVAHAFQETP